MSCIKTKIGIKMKKYFLGLYLSGLYLSGLFLLISVGMPLMAQVRVGGRVEVRLPKIRPQTPTTTTPSTPTNTPTNTSPTTTTSSAQTPTSSDVNSPESHAKWYQEMYEYQVAIRQYRVFFDATQPDFFDRNSALSDNRKQEFEKYDLNMATVDAICKKYPGIKTIAGDYSEWDPDTICTMARVAPELKRKAIMNWILHPFSVHLEQLEKVKQQVSQNDGWITPTSDVFALLFNRAEGTRRIKSVSQKYADPWGINLSESDFAPIWAKVDETLLVLRNAAPSFTFPTHLQHDTRLENMAKNHFGASIQVLKTGLKSTDWTIEYNGSIPKYRYKSINTLLKVSGEEFCRQQNLIYREQYAGNGRYTPNTQLQATENIRIQTCR
jgi:hypothetical protein